MHFGIKQLKKDLSLLNRENSHWSDFLLPPVKLVTKQEPVIIFKFPHYSCLEETILFSSGFTVSLQWFWGIF